MGIPRLTTHLETFQILTTVGCTTPSCSKRTQSRPRSVVIDGPGLAYHIYHRLLGRNGGTSALEAQPTYKELGDAVVSSLQFLESCGLVIGPIFFDGGLPESKRETRVQRLTDAIGKLNAYKSVHGNGFKTGTTREVKLKGYEVFCSRFVPLFAKNGPSATFLVPAVFEALKKSQFADCTQLVPAEADLYLATATRQSDDYLCLTGDSDLAIHDLRDGELAFFTSLEATSCSNCHRGHVLTARVLQQKDMLRKFGTEATIQELVDLGFELRQDPRLGFEEIVRRVRAKTSAACKARLSGWTEALDVFTKDYLQDVDMDSLRNTPQWCQQLDNRISELVVQGLSREQGSLHSYLLPLLEDPERSPAWLTSRDIRQLAYSILLTRTAPGAENLIEITRSGKRIVETVLPVLSRKEIAQQLESTQDGLQQVAEELNQPSNSAISWIVFAVVHAYRWYLVEGKAPPGARLIKSALGSHQAGKLAWEAIHLRAQIQGNLFALRMLNQMLAVPDQGPTCDNAASHSCILSIDEIILTNSQLSAIELARYAEFAVSMACSTVEQSAGNEIGSVHQDTHPDEIRKPPRDWSTVKAKHAKKRKRGRAPSSSAASSQPIRGSQNSFDVLR